MRFGVLGPLQIRDDSGGRELPAPTPRRVLAMLLTAPNRPVSVDTLITELWGEKPPRLARKTVQTHVYQLRRELRARGSGPVIETCHDGYLVRLGPGELDLWEFEEGVAAGEGAARRGDVPGAVAALRAALALWRGPALADVRQGELLAAWTTRTEETRLRAVERCVELSLGLGRHRDLVDELTALTAEHPLHEGFHAQLMTALAGSGDRNGALAVYRRLRQRMAEELGLDPSERLRRLHESLLRGTGGVRPPAARTRAEPPAPAQLPSDIGDFVGRAAELAAVESALRTASDTAAAPVAVVAGEPGIGKTALAVRAGRRLGARFTDGQLFATLRDADGTAVDPGEVLGSFLTSVGHAPERLPRDPRDRERAFRSWTAHRRVLVVLDDAASTEQVASLLPGGPGCAVLVTSQVGLLGLEGARVLGLGPLSDAEGVRLLAAVAGRERVAREPEAADRIVRLCEGLPLAVRAAGEKLAARPPWSLRGFAERLRDENRRLDELRTGALDIRERFAAAHRRLPPHYRWALRRLCVFGADRFDQAAAAAVLGTDPLTAECPTAELANAHLLRVVDVPGDDRLWFRLPELVRLYVEALDEEPVPAVLEAMLRDRGAAPATDIESYVRP